jgi:putative acetyltransferase
VQIARVSLDDDDALRLIAALNRELAATYPEEGATHFRLDANEVTGDRGAFLVARVDGAAVGCGAVRLLDDGRAEIKRMYTSPPARGRGVGRALLTELERVGRELGARELVLETGVRQTEAMALYQRAGFGPIAAWGEYVDSPLSVCLGKAL